MIETVTSILKLLDVEECDVSTVPYQKRCHYITKHCVKSWQYLPNKTYYCGGGHNITRHLAILIGLLVGLGACLSLLSVLVSQYFYPHLDKLAAGYLKFNSRLVTFTIIPLMNAFPDLINYHFTLSTHSKDIELVLGTICGSILILLSVVIGLIALLSPTPIPITKNLYIVFNWCFLVFAAFAVILSDGVITMGECYVLVLLYVCYIAYLVGFDKSTDDYETEPYNVLEIIEDEIRESRESILLLDDDTERLYCDDNEERYCDDDESDNIKRYSLTDIVISSVMKLFSFFIPLSQLTSSWLVYFWYLESCLILYYELSGLPLTIVSFVVLITIDTIMEGSRDLLQIVTGTGISLFIIGKLSFMALLIIRNLGMILPISNFLLGFLIFSIGSSLGDIITNLTISLRININYGTNACLGSPLLLILLGLGVNGLATMYHLKVTHLDFHINYNTIVLVATLLLISSIYLIYIPLNGWVLDKKLGVLMLSIYISLVILVTVV